MGKMKELIGIKAEEIARDTYGKYFGQLNTSQQNEVWKLAQKAGEDYLAAQIDAERDKMKYGH